MSFSVFEIIMLVCFSVSWPISTLKAVRSKTVAGKSPVFIAVVLAGYLSGIVHKLFYSLDPVILLYAFNFLLVAVDLVVYFHYMNRERRTLPA